MCGFYVVCGLWACKVMCNFIHKSKMTQLNRMFFVDIMVFIIGKNSNKAIILECKKDPCIRFKVYPSTFL